MADVKASQLPAATTAVGMELAGVQGGDTKRLPVALLGTTATSALPGVAGAKARSATDRAMDRVCANDWDGADPTASTDSHAAIQAACVHAGTLLHDAEVILAPGRYLLSAPLRLPEGVILTGAGGNSLPGNDTGRGSQLRAMSGVTGFLVEARDPTTLAWSRRSGVTNLALRGLGAGTALGGFKAGPNADGRNVVMYCGFDNFADQAIFIDDGYGHLIVDNFAQGCLLNETRAAHIGVLHIGPNATDCFIRGGEYSSAIGGAVSHANLYINNLLLEGSTSEVDGGVYEFGDVGIRVTGARNRIKAARADFNRGHGVVLSATNYLHGVMAINSSQAAANTYDSFSVLAGNSILVACVSEYITGAAQGDDLARYAFNDTQNSGGAQNWYMACRHNGAIGTAVWNTPNFLDAAIQAAPVGGSYRDITGATPSVAQLCTVRAANGSTTTIINFTGGHNGQLLIVGASNGNTTIQNNSTIKTANGLDIVLSATDWRWFINQRGVWYEIGPREKTPKVLTIPIYDWRTVNAVKDVLPDTPNGTTLGLADSGGSPLASTSTNNTTASESADVVLSLPGDYVTAGTITVNIRARVTVARQVSATIDAILAEVADNAFGGDLVTTAPQALTTSFADYTFGVNAATLAPGKAIRLRIVAAANDTGGSSGGVIQITKTWLSYAAS